MVLYSQIYVNGSFIQDTYNYNVNKSISENNASSSFNADIENYAGRHKTDFSVGQEVTVYADNKPMFTTPAAYFKLNEGTGTIINDSVSGAIGSLIGSTVWASGQLGSSLNFKGVSGTYVNLGSNSKIKPQFITLSTWFNIGSNANLNSILCVDNPDLSTNPSRGYWLGYDMRSPPNKVWFEVGIGSTKVSNNPQTSMNMGSWNHLVAVYDGACKVYLNGSYLGTSARNGSPIQYAPGSPVFIGNVGLSNNYFLSGNVDDVRIYDVPLTFEEIKAIYNSGLGTEAYNTGSQLIFTGIVENIGFQGEGLEDTIKLEGRDYSARLVDRTVEPEVYTNWEIGSIVRDIMTKYTTDVSVSGVQNTGITLDRIAFRHTPVFDAIKQLADQADYQFYVDEFKDLHFEPKGNTDSGYNLIAGSNITEGDFTVDRESVYNQIWVYGDRYLDNYQETFKGGSYTSGYLANGSAYTLIYNPHNTEITVGGTLIQPGNIQNVNYTAPSGTKYLVNYDDRQIVFTSGTNYGNNIPGSNVTILVKYKRSLPIVKVGDNEESKAIYSQRTKVTIDKDIKDPNTAQALMEQQLGELSNPKIEGNLVLKDIINITPGENVDVYLPNYNISGVPYTVIESNYDFSKENNLKGTVQSVKLNRRIGDLTDSIKKVMLDLRKIQAGDINDTDIITRFQYSTGSIGVRTSGVQVYTRTILNPFLLGHPTKSLLGSYAISDHALGGSYSAYSLIYSGGYF